MSNFIRHFSPQRSNPEDLERILVQQEPLLAESVQKIRESVLTKNKHHLLFIGPRGAGKTNLLALMRHRLGNQKDLDETIRFAWLNEDATSSSFLKLLIRIYNALASQYPEEFTTQIGKEIIGKKADDALPTLKQAFIKQLGSNTCIVMIENLDALFEAMPEGELRRWRAFLQDHSATATIATAQSLFAGVSKRDNPFFGFFDINHLEPLSEQGARELLKKVLQLKSTNQKEQELIETLDTPKAQARLKAIHQLTGGNPRLYLILADFLSLDTLDTLISAFEKMVDQELTPYYQERLRWLSQQQREIVEFLCQDDHRIVPVKAIANALFTEHASIASQLKKLKGLGYVINHPKGRQVYYEIAEPLMRLSFQVKEIVQNEGAPQPLRLLVDLLRAWYERGELETTLLALPSDTLTAYYYKAALTETEKSKLAEQIKSQKELLQSIDPTDCTEAEFKTLERAAAGSTDFEILFQYGEACSNRDDYENALDALNRALRIGHDLPQKQGMALLERGIVHIFLDQFTEAIEDCTAVVKMKGTITELQIIGLSLRGIAFESVERFKDAIEDYTTLLEMEDTPEESRVEYLFSRGGVFVNIERFKEAIEDYTTLLEMENAPAETRAKGLLERGFAFGSIERPKEAIEDYTALLEMENAPAEIRAKGLLARGVTFGSIKQIQEGIDDVTTFFEMEDTPAETRFIGLLFRGIAYTSIKRTQEGIDDFTALLEIENVPAEARAKGLFWRGMGFNRIERPQEAIEDYTALIEMKAAPVELRTNGLLSRATCYGQNNKFENGLSDLLTLLVSPGSESKPEYQNDSLKLAVHYLSALSPTSDHISKISEFITSAQTLGKLPELGSFLIEALTSSVDPEVNFDEKKAWATAWETVGKPYPELEIPIRIFKTGISYLESNDESILLKLPQEERNLLLQAIKPDKNEN